MVIERIVEERQNRAREEIREALKDREHHIEAYEGRDKARSSV